MEGRTGPAPAVEDATVLGVLVRRDAHRLNNLILVVQGNVEILSMEHRGDSDVFRDIMQALKECREITGRLLDAGRRLSRVD